MDTWTRDRPDHGHESWEEYAEHSLTHDDLPAEVVMCDA